MRPIWCKKMLTSTKSNSHFLIALAACPSLLHEHGLRGTCLVSDSEGTLWFPGSPGFADSNCSRKDVETVFLFQHWGWEIQQLQQERQSSRSLKVRKQDLKSNTLGTYSAILTDISFCFSLSVLPNEQLSSIKQNHPVPFMLKIHCMRQLSKRKQQRWCIVFCVQVLYSVPVFIWFLTHPNSRHVCWHSMTAPEARGWEWSEASMATCRVWGAGSTEKADTGVAWGPQWQEHNWSNTVLLQLWFSWTIP